MNKNRNETVRRVFQKNKDAAVIIRSYKYFEIIEKSTWSRYLNEINS